MICSSHKCGNSIFLPFTGNCNYHQPHSFLYMDSCFTLHFEPVTWSMASLKCSKDRSRLARMKTKRSINDISEEIAKFYREKLYYWIGLKRSHWHIDNLTGIV